jgi:sugar lactone lactonase YvrE
MRARDLNPGARVPSRITAVGAVAVTAAAVAVGGSVLRRRAAGREPRPVADALPQEWTVGALEPVAAFAGSMPTGVTVTTSGRIFVNYPRWGDPVPFTVAEVKAGTPVAYPDAPINRLDAARARETFVSVQSVVVDPRHRLWVLDTGSVKFAPVAPGGAKLVGIDLATNRIVKTIHFPVDVALPTTYLNDVRFDLRKGGDGVAYITDSSDQGPNGIIVVDLATGHSRRRLHDHPSTKAEPNFLPFVEGQPVMRRRRGQPPQHIAMGSDGIAIGSDGRRLFYCPLASRRLYSVETDALLNDGMTDAQVGATVRDEGTKPASDGLESDAQGRVYATAYEHNGIVRRRADGAYETIVHDPRALWPDTLALAADGYLYFTANQLHRQPDYQEGRDLRVTPYSLFRVKVDATPVQLQ